MNEQIIEQVTSNQSLMLVAVGVFGTLWVANRIYTILSAKKNGGPSKQESGPAVMSVEVIKDLSVTMSMLAKTIERMESDMSIVRENLASVKEAVNRIEAHQRDRPARHASGAI